MIGKIKQKWENLKHILNFKYKTIRSRQLKRITQEEIRYVLEVQFKHKLNYRLNLDKPKTFNEKIQWLKVYYHNPLITKCSDKVEARNYIKDVVGEKYLVPCLDIYNNPKEIEFNKFPNQFVIKTNWGCRQNIFCRDKSTFDVDHAIKKLTGWIKPEKNLYHLNFEWQYKDIKPKIICEKLLIRKDGLIAMNYKFLCFNGEYKYLMVTGIHEGSKFFNFYDKNLNLQPFIYDNVPNNNKVKLEINNYDEMISIAEKLAKPFPLVRVDLYEDGNNNIYVGELTFTPGNGTSPFDPIEWDYKFGEMLKLPEKFLND